LEMTCCSFSFGTVCAPADPGKAASKNMTEIIVRLDRTTQ
jgi:hypothetical protein